MPGFSPCLGTCMISREANGICSCWITGTSMHLASSMRCTFQASIPSGADGLHAAYTPCFASRLQDNFAMQARSRNTKARRQISVRWPGHRYIANLRGGAGPPHLPPAFVPELLKVTFKMLGPESAGAAGAEALPVFGPDDSTHLTLLFRNFTLVLRDFDGAGSTLHEYEPLRRLFQMRDNTAVCFSNGCVCCSRHLLLLRALH